MTQRLLTRWFLTWTERGNPSTRLDARHLGGAAWTEGNMVRPLIHGATQAAARGGSRSYVTAQLSCSTSPVSRRRGPPLAAAGLFAAGVTLGNRIVWWLRLSPTGRLVRMRRLVGLVVVIWLAIGAVAVGQRGYFGSSPQNCAGVATVAGHGRGRTPELPGGQPQSKVPISAAFELS